MKTNNHVRTGVPNTITIIKKRLHPNVRLKKM